MNRLGSVLGSLALGLLVCVAVCLPEIRALVVTPAQVEAGDDVELLAKSDQAEATPVARETRKERAAKRRAWRVFREAAKARGGLLKLAKELDAGEAEALEAVKTAAEGQKVDDDIDWEKLLELIMEIVKLLIELFTYVDPVEAPWPLLDPGPIACSLAA